MFSNVFRGKTVFVTGHTGFKGSWLSFWLKNLGANVVGYSSSVPTVPSLYESLSISDSIVDIRGDVNDIDLLSSSICKHSPDFLFHLAAQPVVGVSYKSPLETWISNTIGTVNILESLRRANNPIVSILITSDKVYRNKEWLWGYREVDQLGGIDPYSASKACAELAISSYVDSFFSNSDSSVLVSSARAGNVIGGGDWAEGRIIPDAVRSWNASKELVLRSPDATRPWQHVLEPLSGYLWLAASLKTNPILQGESFNFGPADPSIISVLDLIKLFSSYWPDSQYRVDSFSTKNHESTLLKLNCDKAYSMLGWTSVWDFKTTVKQTALWYKCSNSDSPRALSSLMKSQLDEYITTAKHRSLAWAL